MGERVRGVARPEPGVPTAGGNCGGRRIGSTGTVAGAPSGCPGSGAKERTRSRSDESGVRLRPERRALAECIVAEREREERGLDDFGIVTGGTHPAEAVHPEVVEAMREVGMDRPGREPREVSTAELEECDVVATMGCSTLKLDADTDVRDWALPDPDGESPERVREVREEVRERVEALFDELGQRAR